MMKGFSEVKYEPRALFFLHWGLYVANGTLPMDESENKCVDC